MHEHGSLPRARKDGLLVDAAGDELLIYDQDSHIGHCLSPVAARVWRCCDGEREVSELAEVAGASEDLVLDALRELREKDLLVAESQSTEPQPTEGAAPGVSRREAIGQGVRYGAAAAAVPLIVSATAATPAMASSGEAFCKSEPDGGGTCCVCSNGSCMSSTKSEDECITNCGGAAKFKEWKTKFVCT